VPGNGHLSFVLEVHLLRFEMLEEFAILSQLLPFKAGDDPCTRAQACDKKSVSQISSAAVTVEVLTLCPAFCQQEWEP
jgi:hypothetical protein